MFKTFSEAEKYLLTQIPNSESEKFPGELGIKRMRLFLEKLGNPQLNYPTIHVAGTSGKGSTAFLTAKILEQAGKKTGLHTSPHLQTVRERFRIDSKMISEQEYVDLINFLAPVIEDMETSQYGRPSYFEILVGAVFVYFDQHKVDVAVIEAGLGGEFDGTNVLKATVTVLTNVGLDHTNILGKTKGEILHTKMQIIKPGNAIAVTGVTQPKLLKVLRNHCQENKVPLLILRRDILASNISEKNTISKLDFKLKNFRNIKNVLLSSPGTFQIKNASLAIASSLIFAKSKNFEISDKNIKKALSESHFPGRFEIIGHEHKVVLDGAHNQDKIKALTESLDFLFPREKFVLIFGLKKNKPAKTLLKLLSPYISSAVITQFGRTTDMGLNLFYPADKLAGEARKILSCPCYLEPDPTKAFKKAREISQKNKNKILVTGSLYLVGEIRDLLMLKSK